MSSTTIIYNTSYIDRLKESFWDVVIGIVLTFSSIIFIWMIEKAAVRFTLIFGRCKEACRVVQDVLNINPAFHSRPVLMRGTIDCKGQGVDDPEVGFMAHETPYVVRLKRTVEMFQWVRHEREEEKRKIVTFTSEWKEIDQGDYASEGHHNPRRDPPLSSKYFNSSTAQLGAFKLIDEQINKLNLFKLCAIPVVPNTTMGVYSHLGPHVERGMKMHHSHGDASDLKHDAECYTEVFEHTREKASDYLVFRGNLINPPIGTVRVSYEYIKDNDPVTVVAVQTNATFRPYFESDAHKVGTGCFGSPTIDNDPYNMESGETDTYQEPEPDCGGCSGCLESLAGLGVGDRVLLVEERHANLETMFGDESAKFRKRLWMMRTCGMVFLMLGIYLLFSPIPALLSFLPFVPSMIRTGFFIIAIVLGGLLSSLVSSLAWAVYHPEYLATVMISSGAILMTYGQTTTALFLGKASLVLSIIPVVLFVMGVVEHYRFSALQRELDLKAQFVQQRQQPPVVVVGENTSLLQKQL